MTIHSMYHNPRWLEQLYYFVHLLFLTLLFGPEPHTCLHTKHLYFPFSLDTKARQSYQLPP